MIFQSYYRSVAGDDQQQKQPVQKLMNEIGFDGVAGGLRSESWRLQPGTTAYCQDLDMDRLRAALLQAVRHKQAEYRTKADDRVQSYFQYIRIDISQNP